MFEHAICHAVALKLSFHNAAEGDSWRQEKGARGQAYAAWEQCRAWLYLRGELKEFMTKGQYLISWYDAEVRGARHTLGMEPLDV